MWAHPISDFEVIANLNPFFRDGLRSVLGVHRDRVHPFLHDSSESLVVRLPDATNRLLENEFASLIRVVPFGCNNPEAHVWQLRLALKLRNAVGICGNFDPVIDVLDPSRPVLDTVKDRTLNLEIWERITILIHHFNGVVHLFLF